MKRAKSKAKKAATTTKSINANHLTLIIDNKSTIEELNPAQRLSYNGYVSEIRELMTIHNALIDSMEMLTSIGKNAIKRACLSIEIDVNLIIESMNEFLDVSLESQRNGKIKKGIKNEKSKKPSKKPAKKRLNKK